LHFCAAGTLSDLKISICGATPQILSGSGLKVCYTKKVVFPAPSIERGFAEFFAPEKLFKRGPSSGECTRTKLNQIAIPSSARDSAVESLLEMADQLGIVPHSTPPVCANWQFATARHDESGRHQNALKFN